ISAKCFTILWQEPGIQALWILNSKKQWINATPIPGMLVIEYPHVFPMQDGIFRSTMHRAVNRCGVHRYSISLFIGTDPHAEVEGPLPSCISPDRPSKYEIISLGKYVQQRLQDMY
ncbi:hypothetical protein EDC04DRAFT_2504912, partial [Pisolithus marmoratus]